MEDYIVFMTWLDDLYPRSQTLDFGNLIDVADSTKVSRVPGQVATATNRGFMSHELDGRFGCHVSNISNLESVVFTRSR